MSLIQAHTTLFNHDIVSLCETSPNDTIELPDELIDHYKFITDNSPSSKKQGSVGIFYRESLPLKTRCHLSFNECLVVELKFAGKRYFGQLFIKTRLTKPTALNLTSF